MLIEMSKSFNVLFSQDNRHENHGMRENVNNFDIQI